MNEPDQWTHQAWVIPGEVRISRAFDDWTIDFASGNFRVFVPTSDGVQLATWADAENTRRNRKYRRSLSFRWTRFWYLRRHKKQRQ